MNITQLRDICAEMLRQGRQQHRLATGIVSRISNNRYEVFAVDSGTGIPQVGDIFDASAVYCREVLEKVRSVAITQIDDTLGMCLHPLYEIVPCEAYISSPLIVDGSVWGTLNYTSFEKRSIPFSGDDIAFNENQAAAIVAAIKKAGL